MNPLVSSALQSIFRWALTFVASFFVSKGIWSSEDASTYVAAAAVALATLVWGLWDKYKSQQKQQTTIAVANALTGPTTRDITSADIDQVIKQGDAAPAATPKDQAPVLNGTGDGMASIKRMTGTGAAILLAFTLSACASSGVKVRISAAHQIARGAIVAFDDAERALCQPRPTPNENTCGSPLAVPAGLTDAKHQSLSRQLVELYRLDVKASTAIIAWRAGDPVPADLTALLKNAEEFLSTARTLTANSLVQKAQDLVTRINELLAMFRQTAALSSSVRAAA